ncbi:helix-turn-helix transcriptional regulator [Clostridium intestinale]|uniref:helix-turn-helix domain-containing protein n=1 Tax=Clostridium intestinale TaxID=36845 RepID=UPI002DD69F34|nr:helix-turn-helix transcriptional regulator [Clostridium intestinale]WRY52647.1 helix-turn-helix transcriptional regulator [Clostridium intestinale]
MNTFGKRIKSLRQKMGLTQVELGKILNVTDLAVTKWESDAILPNTITLIKIADYFNVSIDYLLCRKYISYISSGNNVVKIHEKYPYNLSPEDVERLINYLRDIGFDIDRLIKKIKESSK